MNENKDNKRNRFIVRTFVVVFSAAFMTTIMDNTLDTTNIPLRAAFVILGTIAAYALYDIFLDKKI